MALVDQPISGSTRRATRAQMLAYGRKQNEAHVLAKKAKGVVVAPLSSAELAEIVDGFIFRGAYYRIAADAAFAQCLHETAALTFGGQVAKWQHNVAGLGATNDGAAGGGWPTWVAGIDAYYVHLLAWCNDRRGDKDYRIAAVRQEAAKKGWATSWASLAGRWAVPGVGYGEAIERGWQGILAEPEGTTVAIQKPPMVISHTPHKFGYSQGVRQQLMICDHITASKKSTYYLDTPALGWLRDAHPDANGDETSPSVNYLIGRSGKIVEIVDPHGPAPWTNGIDYGRYPNGKRPNLANPIIADVTRRKISPNQVCITIEHEGEDGGEMNAAQWASSIALHIWLCHEFQITPDAIHIVGHNQWDGIDRPYCPGWTEAQWANLRAKVAAGLGGTGKVPIIDDAQEDEMPLPAPGTAETRIAPDGTPYTVINWDGKATKILGTNFKDVGVSLVGADGETTYDRSIQNGTMQEYAAHPKS